MSAENLALAREVVDALGRRDADALVALTDPEVEWHSFFALGGTYRGHQGTREYVSDLTDAWEVARADVDEWFDDGNVVAMVGRIQYRGKGSGVESETPVGWVLEFRGGRILRFRAFRDAAAALAAAGLER